MINVDLFLKIQQKNGLKIPYHFFQFNNNNEKIKSQREKILDSIVQLKSYCNFEYEVLIYSFFLYFSGIVYLKKDKKEELEELKKYFDDTISKTKDRNRKHFFRFIKVYIDIINPEVEDIEVFEELKNCLEDDKYNSNIIFDTIEREHEFMIKILNDTNDSAIYRIDLVKGIFSDSFSDNENILSIIKSIADSGLARLYFIAGDIYKHNKKLEDAIDNFPDNSFALVQKGHILLNPKYQKELDSTKTTNNNRDYGGTNKIFSHVMKLIDEQFNNFEVFKYRIKLEAKLGEAYIYYLHGKGKRAEKKYSEAAQIINAYIKAEEKLYEHYFKNQNRNSNNNSSKDYLFSILQINRGRNIIDNEIKISNISPTFYFDKVIDRYNNAD